MGTLLDLYEYSDRPHEINNIKNPKLRATELENFIKNPKFKGTQAVKDAQKKN